MSPAPAAGGIVAIVPVKRLDAAKSRLADRLSPAERARLVLGMLDRVLCALRAPGCADRTLVVSADAAIREHASARGAFVLDEPDDDPSAGDSARHNAALARARVAAGAWNPDALLVLSADLPLVEADDLRALAALGATNTVVVAPDRDDRGTNALFLRPPDAIPFCFGPDSSTAHRRAAEARGYRVEVYRSPGTAFDLDRPEDLAELDVPPTPYPLPHKGGRGLQSRSVVDSFSRAHQEAMETAKPARRHSVDPSPLCGGGGRGWGERSSPDTQPPKSSTHVRGSAPAGNQEPPT